MIALVFAVSPLATAADDDPATKQVELKKGDKIIFFGDSLTELAGKEEPKKHVTKGYVRIVRETLAEKYKDKDIEVDWVATGGAHRARPAQARRQGRARQEADHRRHPDRLQRRRGGIPKEKFKSGLEELIDRLQKDEHPGGAVHAAPASARSTTAPTRTTRSWTSSPRSHARSPRRRRCRSTTCARRSSSYWKKNNPDNKAQRHPDLRRQPLQRGGHAVRRRADAQEVQVIANICEAASGF